MDNLLLVYACYFITFVTLIGLGALVEIKFRSQVKEMQEDYD